MKHLLSALLVSFLATGCIELSDETEKKLNEELGSDAPSNEDSSQDSIDTDDNSVDSSNTDTSSDDSTPTSILGLWMDEVDGYLSYTLLEPGHITSWDLIPEDEAVWYGYEGECYEKMEGELETLGGDSYAAIFEFEMDFSDLPEGYTFEDFGIPTDSSGDALDMEIFVDIAPHTDGLLIEITGSTYDDFTDDVDTEGPFVAVKSDISVSQLTPICEEVFDF